MTDYRDFSDAPLSLGEHRTSKTGEADSWTPRDALIDVLRQIDSAEIDPKNLIVIYNGTPHESGNGKMLFSASYNDKVYMVGLIQLALAYHCEGITNA